MYKVNKWKLTLILLVFVFAGLYLLPSLPNIYGSLYGHLDLWLQKRVPPPEVVEAEDQPVALKFQLTPDNLPEGTDFAEAVNRMEVVVREQLKKFSLTEVATVTGAVGDLESGQYSFDTTTDNEFLVYFGTDVSAVQSMLSQLELYGSLPHWTRALIPDNRINLGLDLQGGVHLVLGLDMEESKAALLRDKELQLRDELRNAEILCESVRRVPGRDQLLVDLKYFYKDQTAAQRAAYVKKATEYLKEVRFFEMGIPDQSTAPADGLQYTLTLTGGGLKDYSEDAINQVLTVLRNRIDAFGVAEPSIRRDPSAARIIIQLPGAQDASKPLQVVKTMGRLEFKLVKNRGGQGWQGTADMPKPDEIPEKCEVRDGQDGRWYVLESPVLLTGDHIKRAAPQQYNFDIVVTMALDGAGSKKFHKVTKDHVGEQLAILLDDRVQSAPVLRVEIADGRAQIEGDFTADEANYLSKILRAGAFPVGVKIEEERTVGPTLGREAIDRGVRSALIGLTFVIVFMVFYYRLSGVIAVIALLFNMEIMLGVLAGLGATLTLPGLAGLVLTIGMAVDANVLIFERIREELRTGKTVRSAIDSGYQKAFWAILDANVTTLLTALVLYQFGTGPIKGFAVTLSIGIVASMFTALVVTREIYGWIYGNRPVKKLSI